ncbi:MAG: dihydropteroate synthase [Alphaproteobacteria bacterium]|jgi:dihydropteroate synthase|nr:dihydropteroate synthase [Alphaproteobacteria bacterium]
MTAALPQIAGLGSARPLIMGVINATPDSFYDGGRHTDTDGAIAHGMALLAQGADILDVGGESTRPGADPVPEHVELDRVIPVVRALATRGAVVSIDTRNGGVMTAAADAGAKMINDVAALTRPGAMAAAADSGLPVVLLHSDADPRNMQDAPTYDDVVAEVIAYLQGRIGACEAAGIPHDRLIADPGIGFAKTPDHNVKLLTALDKFQDLNVPILLGVSRKSFIGHFSNGEAADHRLPGSLAAALWGATHGAKILRVHDVSETAQAMAIWRAASGEAL